MERALDTDRVFRRPSASGVGLFVLLVVILSVSALASGDDVGEAGDDIDSATPVAPGSYNGTIWRNETAEDPRDFYEMTFDGGDVVVATLTLDGSSSTYLDVHFRVLDRDRSEVAVLDFDGMGAPQVFGVLTNDREEAPSYFLAITWDGSSMVKFRINYTLDLESGDGPQDDAGSGGDAPNTMEDAYLLPVGTYAGSVGGPDLTWNMDANADAVDMYALEPEEGQFLRVTVTLDKASELRRRSLVATLHNETGAVLDVLTVADEGAMASVRFFPKADAGYFLNVSSSAVINNYTLNLTIEVPGADGDGRADAGDHPDHAMAITTGTTKGTIMRGHGAVDLADYLELEFRSSQFVEASLVLRTGTVSTSYVLFRVLDYTKSEVVNFTFSGLDSVQRFAALTNSDHSTLKYYLGVTWEGPEGMDYEFRYELVTTIQLEQDDHGTGRDVTGTVSGAPTVSLEETVTGSVGGTVPQWNSDANVDGADVYEVQPDSRRFVLVSASLGSFHGQRRVGFDIQLQNQSGNLLVKPQSLFEVGDEVVLRHYSETTMPVYIVITSESELCNYTFSISTEDPPEIDLVIANVSVTPARPNPGDEATITVVVGSSVVVVPATEIRVEVFAGGNKLDYRDVIFDATDETVATFPWTVPSTDTNLMVMIDTLNSIPWESNKDNNARTITVKVGGEDGGDEVTEDDTDTLMFIVLMVAIIIVAIGVAIFVVVVRAQDAEDEGPEDY